MSTPPDPFEFVRNLWAQMGIPGFAAGAAPAMPAFAPEELEKRIGELKQIRQWLEINLNMLNLQVNGLEMQLTAIKGFKSSPGGEMAAQAARAMQDAVSGKGVFAVAPPPGPPGPAAPASGPPVPHPEEPPVPRAKAKRARAASAKAPAWPDPTSWMQTLQEEFVKNMKSAGSAGGATPAKPAAAKPVTVAPRGRTAAKKRTRGSP